MVSKREDKTNNSRKKLGTRDKVISTRKKAKNKKIPVREFFLLS